MYTTLSFRHDATKKKQRYPRILTEKADPVNKGRKMATKHTRAKRKEKKTDTRKKHEPVWPSRRKYYFFKLFPTFFWTKKNEQKINKKKITASLDVVGSLSHSRTLRQNVKGHFLSHSLSFGGPGEKRGEEKTKGKKNQE